MVQPGLIFFILLLNLLLTLLSISKRLLTLRYAKRKRKNLEIAMVGIKPRLPAKQVSALSITPLPIGHGTFNLNLTRLVASSELE